MQEIMTTPSRGVGSKGRTYIEITARDGRQYVILLGKDGLRWAPVRNPEELSALIGTGRAATGDELQLNAARSVVQILENGQRRQYIDAGFINRFVVGSGGKTFEISALLAKRAQVLRIAEQTRAKGKTSAVRDGSILIGQDMRWTVRGLTLYRDRSLVLSTLPARDIEREWEYHRDLREEALLETYEEALAASRVTFRRSGMPEDIYQAWHEWSLERLKAAALELEANGLRIA